MKLAAAAAALVFCCSAASAQTVSDRGFAEVRVALFPQTTTNDDAHGVVDLLVREELFVAPPQWSWVRFAGGIDLRANSHHQVDAVADAGDRTVQRPAASLRRLSATLDTGNLTVDVGKQLIRWARADVVNPIDRFAPRDYLNVIETEFLPVIGVRPTLQIRNESLEAVWTWRLTPSRMPLLDQRWTTLPPEAAGLTIRDAGFDFPGRGQIGLRWRHTGGRVETGASLFDGFTHHPHIAVAPGDSDDIVTITRTFPRLRMYALDTAVPTAWVTFKAEAAYFTSPDDRLRSYSLYVIEGERQFGEWLFTLGYAGDTNSDAAPPLAFDPERAIAPAFIGRASYTVDPRRTVTVELAARQNGRGQYAKGEYSHAVGQRWRVTLAGVVLAGRGDDFLGQFDRNSHLSTALRFSF
jgi:hypothetical protein